MEWQSASQACCAGSDGICAAADFTAAYVCLHGARAFKYVVDCEEALYNPSFHFIHLVIFHLTLHYGSADEGSVLDTA